VNVWILCNEDAGRGLSSDDLRALVEGAGHTVLDVAKDYNRETPLPAGRLDLVVAAGGDGTVATVAGIALETSAALAILPLGTANNIANSLGVRAPAEVLVSSWSTARRIPFDLGRARAGSREWLFVEGVGGGLVPAGIARAEREGKTREEMPPAAEIAAAVRTFRDALVGLEPRPWSLVVDDTPIADELLLVEILNIPAIGPNLVFGPLATPSDGFFDVVMARECHREELLTYLEHRAEGRESRLALPRHRARHVAIERGMELHIDDERVDACEWGPVTIDVTPGAIRVLA
jgi:diacylglycerol kinase family enzyme